MGFQRLDAARFQIRGAILFGIVMLLSGAVVAGGLASLTYTVRMVFFFTFQMAMMAEIVFCAWALIVVIRGPAKMPIASNCLQCAYDLRHNESGICPECGTAIPEEQREKLKDLHFSQS
jgi:hypothetical protein